MTKANRYRLILWMGGHFALLFGGDATAAEALARLDDRADALPELLK